MMNERYYHVPKRHPSSVALQENFAWCDNSDRGRSRYPELSPTCNCTTWNGGDYRDTERLERFARFTGHSTDTQVDGCRDGECSAEPWSKHCSNSSERSGAACACGHSAAWSDRRTDGHRRWDISSCLRGECEQGNRSFFRCNCELCAGRTQRNGQHRR